MELTILSILTGGHSIAGISASFTLYVIIGLIALFLALVITLAVLDNCNAEPLGNLKITQSKIVDEESQIQPNKETYNSIRVSQTKSETPRSIAEINDVILFHLDATLSHRHINSPKKVYPLQNQNQVAIKRTESIKLRGTSAKIMIFHNYLTPFTTIPDSISRTKKALLLFLRVMAIYYLTGAMQTNIKLIAYIEMITALIKGNIIIGHLVNGGIVVVVISILLYFINFVVVVPSAERIIMALQKKGVVIEKAVKSARSKVECVRRGNIFGVCLIIILISALAGMSLIMPSNYSYQSQVNWMATFGLAIFEDVVVFQMVKVIILIGLIGCCGGSKERTASECGIWCNSFVAGKIVYL